MKKATSLLTLLILLSACNNFSNEYAKSQEDLASARDSICILQKQIEQLSYPANQRLDNINKLIQEGNFESAQIELKNLVALFPNSKEAQLEPNLKSKIELPNCDNIIISSDLNSLHIDEFEEFEIFGLDYEEFILFYRKNYEARTLFSHFLIRGNLAFSPFISEFETTAFLQKHIKASKEA